MCGAGGAPARQGNAHSVVLKTSPAGMPELL